MKKSIIFAAFAVVLSSFTFSSCDNDTPVDEILPTEEEAYAFDNVKWGMNVEQVNAVKGDNIRFGGYNWLGGDVYDSNFTYTYTIGGHIINSDEQVKRYEWRAAHFKIDPKYGLYMMSLTEYLPVDMAHQLIDRIAKGLNTKYKWHNVNLKDPHAFAVADYWLNHNSYGEVNGIWKIGDKTIYLFSTSAPPFNSEEIKVVTVNEKISKKAKSHIPQSVI